MLRRFLSKGRLYIAASVVLVAVIGTIMLLSCSKDNPVKQPDATWAFTVDVLDGYTGNKIQNARVQYMTKELLDTVGLTNSQGRLKIEGLTAGTQSFTISNSDTTVPYTSVVIQATSIADTTGLKKLADQSQTVKLFPLTGSISGRVVSQIHELTQKVAATDVVVAVSFNNPDLTTASNVASQIKTDATGAFLFSRLPVATGVKVTVSSIPIGGIDFAAEQFEMPVLVSGITVPLGTIIMKPIDAKNFKLMSALPTVIAPNQTIALTYSDPIDSASYATLEGVGTTSQTVKVNCTFSGAKINITPAISLVDGSQYRLTVYAFGKNGGSLTSTQPSVTVKGGGLIDVVASNVLDMNHMPKDGLGLSDSMVFTFREVIDQGSASVSKLNGTVVLVDVTTQGSTLTIKPKGNWEAGTYTVKVSANLHDATSSSFTIQLATVGGLDFVSSNIYNPKTLNPINGLGFKDTISVTANKTLASAQVTLSQAGTPVVVSSTVSGATVKVVSADNLRPSTQYTFNITVSTAQGESKSFSSTFTTASSDFYPIVDNIRFDNDPDKPVLNFAPNGTIFIKMSSAVKSATAQLSGPSGLVAINVTVNADSIKITSVANLPEGGPYYLVISAESNTGTVYNENNGDYVSGFYIQANKVFVKASNVMNTNGLGLTNIPVTTEPYYVLSATPVEASLAVVIKPNGGTAINAIVSVSGDTVKIKPVQNLAAGTKYVITIQGKSTQNQTIDMDMNATNKAAFTTREAVFVVATNMQDADGNPVSNLTPSTELWAKFSRPLSTDLTQQKLGGGTGTTITYEYGATSNNATIRVSGDTLFANFLPNMLPAYGAAISLTSVSLLFNDATTLGAGIVDINAEIMKKATPYVIATNGMKNNAVVDTFGVLSESWIVSSLAFRSIDAIKNGPDGLTNVADANKVLSNVRTSGDTIFFKPAVRLGYATEYQVAFEVTLADSSKYTGSDLKLRWKTVKPLYLISVNDMAAGFTAYRPFSVTGDSLVLTLSRAVDVTKTYSIAGFVTKVNYLWSNGNTTLTVKPVDTLKARAYNANPDYTVGAAAEYGSITITLTAADGEAWTTKATNVSAIFNSARPALAVHTVPGIEVLNTNVKVSSVNKSLPYVNTDNRALSALITASLVAQNDSVNVGDTLKVFFSRAVDSAAIATTPAMIQVLLGTVVQNVSISYTSDHKTVFIKPLTSLTPATTYQLSLVNVKALGLLGDANGKVSYSTGANKLDFKTRPLATKPVTAAVIALNADTSVASNVMGNRLGYSGSKSAAYQAGLIPTDVPAVNNIKVMWYEVAFRSALSTDTVSHYQFSVKGVDNNWYDLKAMIAATHFEAFTPLADSLRRNTLNLSGTVTDVNNVNVGPVLRVVKKANNQNDDNIFNYGAAVQLRIRPVVSSDANWDAADQSGNWSTPITFQDNIAPCDTDFVAIDGSLANLNLVAKGGVSVTPPVGFDMDRSGGDPVGYYTITFAFPEDMDTSTKPTITTYYGGVTSAPSTGLNVDNSRSYWNNGYTYQLTVAVPADSNFAPGGTYKPYFAVSIAGMKDASGQTIQTWGSVGDAANNKLQSAVAGQKMGTVNLIGCTVY